MNTAAGRRKGRARALGPQHKAAWAKGPLTTRGGSVERTIIDAKIEALGPRSIWRGDRYRRVGDIHAFPGEGPFIEPKAAA